MSVAVLSRRLLIIMQAVFKTTIRQSFVSYSHRIKKIKTNNCILDGINQRYNKLYEYILRNWKYYDFLI